MLKYYDKGMCSNNIQHNSQFVYSNFVHATNCATATPSHQLHDVLWMHRYGQLAWKWHPLKNLAYQAEASSMFRNIAEAYQILSDGA